MPADFSIEALGKASELLKSTKFRTKPQIRNKTLSFNRKLFSFTPTNIRLATFTARHRINVSITVPAYYTRYLSWRYQTLEICGKYAHITFSKEVDFEPSCGNEIVGIDLGVNNLAVASNGLIFKGEKTRLMQFHYLRRRLQRKGTKSALRHLCRLKSRQACYMRDVNHRVSKAIVASGDSFAMEDLTGIRTGKNRHKGKRLNRWLHSWSFFQLREFVKYKAQFAGKLFKLVNPYMTSQICSRCGHVGSRYLSSFVCPHCDIALDADFNASCNLRRLSVNQPIVACDDAKASPDELRLSIVTSLASVDAG